MNDEKARFEKSQDEKQERERIAKSLDALAQGIAELIQAVKRVEVKRNWIIAKPWNTYSLAHFDGETMYISNDNNESDIYISFDGQPILFYVKAGTSRYLPCHGAKTFEIESSTSGIIPVMIINKTLSYN